MTLWQKLDRADTALSLLDRAKQVADYLGVTDWLRGALVVAVFAAYSVVAHLVSQVPWWISIVVGLVAATALVQLVNTVMVAWSLRGIRALSIPDIGRDCVEFHRDVIGYLAMRKAGEPQWPDGVPTAARTNDMFVRRAAFSRETSRYIGENFAPRAFALAHKLAAVGIPQPNLFHFSSDHGASAVATYVGTVGQLLQGGLVAEAKTLNPQLFWGAGVH